MVGRLEKVELRQVWEHEAHDFTAWLALHLDILSEHINLPLTLLEKERAAGAFSADIFAEGPNGAVVIENQLEKTNHDHLGKLITYLANLDAKTAIWIASEPREEHAKAVNWLNEVAPPDTSFYLVRVEAYRIGTSEPAPHFTVVCGPSQEAKERGEAKDELAEGHVKRMNFWTQLLERASSVTQLHGNVSPSKDSWLAAGAGKAGMGWSYSVTKDHGSVELCIDRGADKKDETDRIYSKLLKQKDTIEKAFGEELIWDRQDGRRVCRIKSLSSTGGLKDVDGWPEIQDDMIDRMTRLESALRGHLRNI